MAEHLAEVAARGIKVTPQICIAEANEWDLGPIPQYQSFYTCHACDPFAVFMHNDVEIHDDSWVEQVTAEFLDPRVAIVGFGGAIGIGTTEIYKRPYDIWQLQRIGYRSNQSDWQTHGSHESGSCDVAVVDGFIMAIRGEFLRKISGWTWFPFEFHCYDTALCLMAARYGWKVRMIGIKCTHRGGGASITPAYQKRCESRKTTPEREHREPHIWMYNEFRDLLPLRIK